MFILVAAIVWHAPSECVLPSAGPDTSTRADARIETVTEGYRLRLRIEREDGKTSERVLTDARCEPLVDSVATLVQFAGVEEDPPAGEAEPFVIDPSVVSDVPERDESNRASKEGESAAPIQFGIDAHGAFSIGLMPSFASGFGASFSAHWRHLLVVAEADAWIGQEVIGNNRGGASFHAWSTGIRFGPVLSSAPLRIAPLAGITYWDLGSEGIGADRNFNVSTGLFTPDISADLAWKVSSSIELRGRASVGWAVRQPSFVAASDEVHRVSAALFSGTIGLGFVP